MLLGRVDADGRPLVPVTVRGPQGSILREALIDMGFTGSLALPSAVIRHLGLLQQGARVSQFADGRIGPSYTYWGVIDWLNGSVGLKMGENGVSEIIIGASLLQGSHLTVDYGASRSVEIR